jgi:glycosyltransferase involved in cell wall biosynthesis
MISVIIPSYNRKNLTHRAVRSVLAQTFADLEVVVVDDGSRDEEVFLCHAVEDRRVRVVRHETNKGVPAAKIVDWHILIGLAGPAQRAHAAPLQAH